VIVLVTIRQATEEQAMPAIRKNVVCLYVDRTTQQWIVRDQEGKYWAVPPTDHPWDDRQPFSPAEETELEPVPRHYKSVLGLPFT
jgi:hypothetical protein